MPTTDVDLPEILSRELPASPARDRLISRCLAREFHDFKSESATPKSDLVDELRRLGLDALAQRVFAGEFDEDADAEDLRGMADEFADSPALAGALRDMAKSRK